MENTLLIVAIAAFIIIFEAISGRLQQTVITAPMAFVLFGLFISERMLGLVETDAGPSTIDRQISCLPLVLKRSAAPVVSLSCKNLYFLR